MKISKSAASIGGLFGRLPGVLPAVLALSVVAPAAHAVPTATPAAGGGAFVPILVPATTAGVYINVVSGAFGTSSATAGWDINPWGSGSMFIWSATTGGIVSAPASPVAAPAVGSTVDVNSTYLVSASAATFGAGAGQWTLNATNYFGFKFIGDDTLLHYGYGTMLVGSTALTRTVTSLFYESVANTGITISAVPEASTTAMMLAGVSLRRRKAAAAA